MIHTNLSFFPSEIIKAELKDSNPTLKNIKDSKTTDILIFLISPVSISSCMCRKFTFWF